MVKQTPRPPQLTVRLPSKRFLVRIVRAARLEKMSVNRFVVDRLDKATVNIPQ